MARKRDQLIRHIEELLLPGNALTASQILTSLLNHPQSSQLLRSTGDAVKDNNSNRRKISRYLDDMTDISLKDGQVQKRKGEQGENLYQLLNAYTDGKGSKDGFSDDDLSLYLGQAINDRFMKAYMPSQYYKRFRDEINPVTNPTLVEKKERLLARIEVMQRSQPLLQSKSFPQEKLDTIYTAILEGMQVSFAYNSKPETRQVQPVGIVFREPRVSLLARDDNDGGKVKNFMIEKMSNIRVLDIPVAKNLVTLAGYIRSGAPALAFGPAEFQQRETIVLEINHNGATTENLVNDIIRHPLSRNQKHRKLANGNLQITLPEERISYHLIEWILGRMSLLTVRKPESLRQYIKKELTKMLENYR